jgi:poly(glycerol-phosphate) alpha-glucosyltransferase
MNAISDWSPDVVHVHGLWMYPSWATRHWRQLDLPYVVTPHGMIDRWALRNSSFKKRLAFAAFERVSLEGAACIHALNEMELDAIRDAGLYGPVAIIPNGTHLPERSVTKSQENRTLLYLGRLHPKKGLAELLTAFAKVREVAPNWKLVIAGWDDGGYLSSLEKLQRDLNLTDSVLFPGPVFEGDKEALFLAADAFILPSKSEGMPMAVLEAWSYGLPVLMTSECNLPRGFTEGAAIQVTCEPAALAKELLSFFLMSPDKHRRLGSLGRDLVRDHYDWARVAEQTIALHSWVSGRASLPDFVDIGNRPFH